MTQTALKQDREEALVGLREFCNTEMRDHLDRAFLSLFQIQGSGMTWISVKDRMPGCRSVEDFLVTDGEVTTLAGYGAKNPVWSAVMACHDQRKWTHWQPLPEPPNPRAEEFAAAIMEAANDPDLWKRARDVAEEMQRRLQEPEPSSNSPYAEC